MHKNALLIDLNLSLPPVLLRGRAYTPAALKRN